MRTITLLLVEGQGKLCSGIMYSIRENNTDTQHPFFFNCMPREIFFLNIFPPTLLKWRIPDTLRNDIWVQLWSWFLKIFYLNKHYLLFYLTINRLIFKGQKIFLCLSLVKCHAQQYLGKYSCLLNPHFSL